MNDSIVAIASARGGAARGIVRIAGREALALTAKNLTLAEDERPLVATHAPTVVRSTFRVAASASLEELCIPVDLFVWPDARSYTRQPTVEIHAPGAPALLDAIAEQLVRNGARAAAPGEFTLRAFLSGRIDLTQAEGVLGVVDARSERDLGVALQQLAGGLSKPLHALRATLLDLLVHIEAGLDFADEDLEFLSRDHISAALATTAATLADLQRQLDVERQRAAVPRVVLAGLPNVGKSSLFNALAEMGTRDSRTARALVAPVAGTTRDYVSVRLHTADIEWELIDTAGTDSVVDQVLSANAFPTCDGNTLPSAPPMAQLDEASQAGTRDQLRQADLVLHCVDATRLDAAGDCSAYPGALRVWTKADLLASPHPRARPSQGALIAGRPSSASAPPAAVSSATGLGVAELAQRIGACLANQWSEASPTAAVGATAIRCTGSLQRAAASLTEARRLLQAGAGDDLLAAELRETLHALGDVSGDVCVDELLDGIFSQFCLGK